MRTATISSLLWMVTCATTAVGQAVWTPRSTPVAPSPRADAAAVVAWGDLEVFGGMLPNGVLTDERWRFDGTSWYLVPPLGVGPSPRADAMVAFDAARGVVVLFGGRDATHTALDDTWELDGGGWHRRNPAHAPSARRAAAFAYDVFRQQCVLFGGHDGLGQPNTGASDETWLWDGIDWVQAMPAQRPPARAWAAVAADPTRPRILLAGGLGATPFADTWSWDGSTWTAITTAHAPGVPGSTAGLFGGAMTHDLIRDRFVWFGGTDGSVFADHVFEFDGGDWLDRGAGGGPAGRVGAALGFSMTSAQTVLFGGRGATGFGDTWTWQTAVFPRVVHHAAGCPNALGTPVLEATIPWLGAPLAIAVHFVPPTATTILLVGATTAQIHLGSVGHPACTVVVTPSIALPMAIDPATGRPTVSIPTPPDPGLVGARLETQAFVFELGATLAISLSDRVEFHSALK